MQNSSLRAGALVYKKENGAVYFLLVSFREYWGRFIIPQGHLEPGETYEQAAVRETAEESGVMCEIERQLGSIQLPRGELCLYLARPIAQGKPQEPRTAEWMTLEQIEQVYAFADTLPFIRKAYQELK